MTFQQIFYS